MNNYPFSLLSMYTNYNTLIIIGVFVGFSCIFYTVCSIETKNRIKYHTEHLKQINFFVRHCLCHNPDASSDESRKKKTRTSKPDKHKGALAGETA
jgi:putative component of membrane protein insertase Oxa1/YidC/SpoIIIJ protein YidD